MPRKHQVNKVFLALLILFLIAADPLLSQEAGPWGANEGYVSNLTITVRRGPGIDYKIIAFLNPGDAVDVIGRDTGWSQVKFGEGRTGWVLERYLTDTPSLLSRREAIQAENERLRGKASILKRSNTSLRTYFDKPAGVVSVGDDKRSHSPQELARALALAKRLLQEERRKVSLLQEQKEMEVELGRWFLIGSGMAGLGMVLGALTNRSRRWFRFKYK